MPDRIATAIPVAVVGRPCSPRRSLFIDLLPAYYAGNQAKTRQQTHDRRATSRPGDFPGDGLTQATGILATDTLLRRCAGSGESEVARLPTCQCWRPGFSFPCEPWRQPKIESTMGCRSLRHNHDGPRDSSEQRRAGRSRSGTAGRSSTWPRSRTAPRSGADCPPMRHSNSSAGGAQTTFE